MNSKIIKILLGIVIIVISIATLLLYLTPNKTNWYSNYKLNSKDPFGYYIIYEELQNLTKANKITEIKHLDELNHLNPNEDAIFYINTRNSSVVKDALDSISNKNFTIFYVNIFSNPSHTINSSTKSTINSQEIEIYHNRFTNYANYFQENDKHKILGTVTIQDSVFPNYIQKTHHKSIIYEHADPKLFTNFYLLKNDGYFYIKEVLKPLQGKNIYWINPNKNYITAEESNSPLSFILSQIQLRYAWYLLLATLVLYILFKSKREQNIIPVVQPEKNLTLEFAHVLSSMYYESGKPQDIIKKQIDYFYYTIRKQFNIATDNIFDEHFKYIMAQKAQITTGEVENFLIELDKLYNNSKSTLKDVEKTYKIIDIYKKKAHIL